MKQLIKNITKKSKDEQNIPFSDFVKVIILMFSLSAILLPHVYIKNQVYYRSVKINKLEKSFTHLKNENKILKIKYNKIFFKNTINDK
jgi:uncharacterized protein with PQ loop repeat